MNALPLSVTLTGLRIEPSETPTCATRWPTFGQGTGLSMAHASYGSPSRQDALHAPAGQWMKRAKIDIARCTVQRLMRQLGIQGVRLGKKIKTTHGQPTDQCPLDKVNRQFRASMPNELSVSDFTFVSTWRGFVYVAFVIDTFANRIVGWKASTTQDTQFVLPSRQHALHAPAR